MPSSSFTQGCSNVDSVTVWLPEVNWKVIVSPSFAVTELGVKAGFWPARTCETLDAS